MAYYMNESLNRGHQKLPGAEKMGSPEPHCVPLTLREARVQRAGGDQESRWALMSSPGTWARYMSPACCLCSQLSDVCGALPQGRSSGTWGASKPRGEWGGCPLVLSSLSCFNALIYPTPAAPFPAPLSPLIGKSQRLVPFHQDSD